MMTNILHKLLNKQNRQCRDTRSVQTAKNQALLTIADSLESRSADILQANEKTLNLQNTRNFSCHYRPLIALQPLKNDC